MDFDATKILELLGERYGPPPPPLGDDPWQRALIVVAQLRSPAEAKKLIDRLSTADLLDARALAEISSDELEPYLSGSGARKSAQRIRELAGLVVATDDGRLDDFFAQPLNTLRRQLGELNGLGPESVERLLLVAGDRPVLPVTTAVQRVGKRHGWFDFDADTPTIIAETASSLPLVAHDCWQLHALLERVGKDYCRAVPNCRDCPLAKLLPEGGPLEPM